MCFTTIVSIVSLKLLRFNFVFIIFIQLDLTLSMSYFNRESDESTNVALMVTVVAVKSILVPVDGSSVLHNNLFVPATVTFSLKVDEALFVKLPVFTVVPNLINR